MLRFISIVAKEAPHHLAVRLPFHPRRPGRARRRGEAGTPIAVRSPSCVCSPASFQVPAICSRSCRACTPFGTQATGCLSPAPNRCGRRSRGRGWTSQPSDRHGMSRMPMRSCPGFRAAGSAGQLGMLAELAPAVVPDLLASPTACGRTCSCASRTSSPPGWRLSAPGCRWWCTPSASSRGRRCCSPPSPGSRSPPPHGHRPAGRP
jgi:hypothetical protein